MGVEIPHGYDPLRDRFTPMVSEMATSESLEARISAVAAQMDASMDMQEVRKLDQERSDLEDAYNHLFPDEARENQETNNQKYY